MTRFIIFSGRTTLLDMPLSAPRVEASFEVQETKRIGFEVNDHDENVTYEILIGDITLSEKPQEYRDRIEWAATYCLDGTSGITPITVRNAQDGSILARPVALVNPSKLSERAYELMFKDMSRITVELLLELISKSRLSHSGGPPMQTSSLKPLTARVELSQIRRFWLRFSSVLAEILENPHMELHNGISIRRPKPGERLRADALKRFAQRGLTAREAVRTGGMFELPSRMPSPDTRENRIIVGFIDLLRRRVERGRVRAGQERDMRSARLSAAGQSEAMRNFLQRREEPKIEKLQEIIENSEELSSGMLRAIRSFALPARRFAPHDFFDSFESSIFRSHPLYARAARMMRTFLNNTAIIIEQGDEEGAKPIETIYEQWVFFQVSAAIQAAGLSCISHNSVFEPIARDRFSVDLDRNAAIDFEAPDKRIIRLRYEPTILPRDAAKGLDTLYRESSSPWTPDLVLEVLMPGDDQRDYRLVYAAVIDAKYTTRKNVWDRLSRIEKYLQIRSIDTDAPIVRQVWVAAPVTAMLQPRDEAITWSEQGEVGATPLDMILGVIGADPSDPNSTKAILKAFILGILDHAGAFARVVAGQRMT